jgi:outer membrane biosynthesis protein TonB
MTAKVSGSAKGGQNPGFYLGGLKGRSAASALFYEELPEELRPSTEERALSISMVWGDAILETKQFRDGQVSIGGDDASDFEVYLENEGRFVLARIKGTSAELNAPAGGEIIVRRKSGEETKGTSATIEFGDAARIRIGAVEMVARFIRPTKSAKSGFFKGMDLYFTKLLSIAVMIHVALLAALLITPLDGDDLSDDLFRNQSRFAKSLMENKEEPKPKLDLSKAKEEKIEEPEFGVKQEAKPEKTDKRSVDASKRESDIKKVRSTGLLAGLGGDSSSHIFGGGGLGAGINNALGGLQAGAGMGDAHGVGGLGTRGVGVGGGGGGLGIGGLGTRGGGGGRGHGITLGGGSKRTTRIIPGRTTVVGGLDRSVIADVIRRYQSQIRFCYEKELQKNPSLEGKVAVQFTIDGTGHVSNVVIQEDTVGADGAVGRCINQRIRRWRFPEPKGGGEVIVSYPWIFRAAGD